MPSRLNIFKKRRNRKIQIFDVSKGRTVTASGNEIDLINARNELWREKHQ